MKIELTPQDIYMLAKISSADCEKLCCEECPILSICTKDGDDKRAIDAENMLILAGVT